MIPLDLLTPALMRVGWRPFVNTADETVPPHGCMREVSTTKSNGEIVYRCAKPNSDFKTLYRINGPFAVPPEGWGISSLLSEGGLVKGSASAAAGEEWGAREDSWVLERHRPGFTIEGAFGNAGLMVAKQREVEVLIGKNSGTIKVDSSGNVRVWMGPPGAWEESEYLLTGVWNLTANISSTPIWCSLARIYGTWIVAPLRCQT